MIRKLLSSLVLGVVLICQVGCVEDDSIRDLRQLDNQLTRLIVQFENAERNFGPSANSHALVQNAHWLDRMIKYKKEVALVEKKAISLGADPITDLRRELDERVARHIRTIRSDMQYVDAVNQMEIAKIWLDM